MSPTPPPFPPPPEKPWERAQQANSWSQNFNETININNTSNTSGLMDNNLSFGNSQQANSQSRPPPLPPRPSDQTNPLNRLGNGNVTGVGNSLSYLSSPYCNSFYGGMGMGSYGSYGLGGFSGLNRFGYGNYAAYPQSMTSPDNEFVRQAEESSRQAFQSIESLVQAFVSVSTMLESTYFAVYSSFRAVIGVADHFSRLKNHLTQVLSTLALIRTSRWLVTKLLYLLGLTTPVSDHDHAWSQAKSTNPFGLPLNQDGTFDANKQPDKNKSSWPIFIFFAVVLGTPWLIWRLLSSMSGSQRIASDKWANEQDEHYEANALYDFQTEHPRELSFSTGQRIIIAPRDLQPRVRGWLLASNGKKVGLIPANYVKILGLRRPKSENN